MSLQAIPRGFAARTFASFSKGRFRYRVFPSRCHALNRRHRRKRANGRSRADLLNVSYQREKIGIGGLLRTPAEGCLAETERFELKQLRVD